MHNASSLFCGDDRPQLACRTAAKFENNCVALRDSQVVSAAAAAYDRALDGRHRMCTFGPATTALGLLKIIEKHIACMHVVLRAGVEIPRLRR
jgi:hypothetical protein